MGHLVQATAILRWSVVRFRRCDGQFRFMTLPCAAFPVLSHHVVAQAKFVSVENGGAGARALLFEPPVKSSEQREGCISGFRGFMLRRNHFRQAASAYEDLGIGENFGSGENFDADSDDEDEEDDGRVYEAGDDYIVVNFYHFVDIEDARHEVARHSAFIEVTNRQRL